MPSFVTQPDTKAIGEAIVAYLEALTQSDNVTPLYTKVQLEEIKDISDYVAKGGACAEVWGNGDGSERRGFGGRIWDYPTWFVLSMVSMDSPSTQMTIYDVRDTVVVPFQVHATLGGTVLNLFHSQIKDGSMKYGKIFRNGQWLRSHLFEVETKAEWTVPIPTGGDFVTQQRAVPEGRRVRLFLLCDSCDGLERASECPACQGSGGAYQDAILDKQAIEAITSAVSQLQVREVKRLGGISIR